MQKKHPRFELQKQSGPCIAVVVVLPRRSMVVATTYHRREVREAVAVLVLAAVDWRKGGRKRGRKRWRKRGRKGGREVGEEKDAAVSRPHCEEEEKAAV